MARERKYGVLLIAGGRTHQENYAPQFAADPRCRLVGLADEPDVPAHRARWNGELAQRLGIPLLDDLDAALARDDVHIVSVCAEPERRARLGTRAALAGKHVYMDKPLGSRLDQIDLLVRAVAQNQVKSQMFSLLRSGWAERARSIVESGRIGKLLGVHCDLLFAKGLLGTPGPVAPRRESIPLARFELPDAKREVFNVGIYSVVLIGWLTGRRVTTVRAVTANYFFAEHRRNNVEDFGALLLQLGDGLVASVTAGRIGWTSHRSSGPNQTVLVGTTGSITIDAYRPRLERCDPGPPWTPPARNPDDPMGFWSSTQAAVGTKPKRDWHILGETGTQSDASYFVDCIEAGRESDLSVPKAAHATEVIFAAYQSAAEGRKVALPLVR